VTPGLRRTRDVAVRPAWADPRPEVARRLRRPRVSSVRADEGAWGDRRRARWLAV